MNPETDLDPRFDLPHTPAPGAEAAAAYLTACAQASSSEPRPSIVRDHSLFSVALALAAGFFLGRLVRR